MMNIRFARSHGAAIVKPTAPRVDTQVAEEFRTAILDLIGVGHDRLVVDLGDVTVMDSAGLGALVTALTTLRVRKADGEIRLANVRPPVVSLLEIIRLHRVFPRYPSVELAAQSFA